ncbi:MAG: aldolase [Candidatus Velthaea sp.]
MSDRAIRKDICRLGERLVKRGLVHGTTGNISVRIADGYLVTPTGRAIDRLEPGEITQLSADGARVRGLEPTKEARAHMAMYEARPSAQAIVHTHSHYCVALTLLPDVDVEDALPALTPYYVMRVGRAPIVPYYPPGDPELVAAVRRYSEGRNALLLAHHGPIVAGTSLEDAAAILEELEEAARLFLLVRTGAYRTLDAAAVATLRERYPTENA